MAVAEKCPGQQRMPGRRVSADGAAGTHSSAGLWAGGLSVPGWNALLHVPVDCALSVWLSWLAGSSSEVKLPVWLAGERESRALDQSSAMGPQVAFVSLMGAAKTMLCFHVAKKGQWNLRLYFFHQRIFLFVCLSRTRKQKAACLDYCECSWGKNEREGMSNDREVLQRWEWCLSLVDTWWGFGSRKKEQMALKLFVFSLALWNLWLPAGLTIIFFNNCHIDFCLATKTK